MKWIDHANDVMNIIYLYVSQNSNEIVLKGLTYGTRMSRTIVFYNAAMFWNFLCSLWIKSNTQCVYVGWQMFERETKREKILEARHREMRLKERSRSEQSKEEESKDGEGEESAEDLVAQAEKEFYEMVEAEMKKREKEGKIRKEKNKVRNSLHSICFVNN